MENDLAVYILVPLVTGLVQAIKQRLTEPARDRWTALIAIACGVAIVGLYQLSGIGGDPPYGGLTGQLAAAIVLHGIATGLAAVGLYHITGDLKGGKA